MIIYRSIDVLKMGTGEKLCDFLILVTRSISCYVFSFYSCWKLALGFSSAFPLSVIFFIITIKVSNQRFLFKQEKLNIIKKN